MIIIKKRNVIIAIIVILILICYFYIKQPDKNYIQTSSTTSKYEILVDVEESRLHLFQDGEPIKTYKCSGRKVVNTISNRNMENNIKSKVGRRVSVGNWMGLNVPWGQFGIHGTLEKSSIGWASSHGCIRMQNNEVAELYKIIPIGTKVTIVDGPYGAFGKGFRNLKSGMYGSDVLEIQKKLKKLGFFTGTINGKFGLATEQAVQKYCKANNIYVRKTINVDLQKQMGFELFE